MSDPLAGRTIALGVSGSIAAYKALTVAARLTEAGAAVDVLLTPAAAALVRPLAFQALTHRGVSTDLWDPQGPMGMDHIAVARRAELFILAPASANLLAELALGLARDTVTTTALATRAPTLIAPAMEPHMWSHPAIQAHVAALRERGATFVGPDEGRLASGAHGWGRMAQPRRIVDTARQMLSEPRPAGSLEGRHVVVAAGPTLEPLDPVRFLSNRSSGRMGYAVAEAARDRGARVTLVTGPVALPLPAGVDAIPVERALEMRDAVLAASSTADALVMAAAVSDFRPAAEAERKTPKAESPLELTLVPNPDILAELHAGLTGPRRPILVGFAAETHDLVSHAREKLRRKGLDLIVANPVPESFGGTTARAVLVDSRSEVELGLATKHEVAEAILDRLVLLLGSPATDR
jgi:phosphopantothenoylcysteine decarboxylase/phosphopantothenate--cysteine ligase